jgi:hypothetical protein
LEDVDDHDQTGVTELKVSNIGERQFGPQRLKSPARGFDPARVQITANQATSWVSEPCHCERQSMPTPEIYYRSVVEVFGQEKTEQLIET